MTQLVFPIVVSIRDEGQLKIVREALLLVREAMIRDWELWMSADAGKRTSIELEIKLLEEVLEQVGWTASGPRRAS